jgi:hypothetical protein
MANAQAVAMSDNLRPRRVIAGAMKLKVSVPPKLQLQVGIRELFLLIIYRNQQLLTVAADR